MSDVDVKKITGCMRIFAYMKHRSVSRKLLSEMLFVKPDA